MALCLVTRCPWAGLARHVSRLLHNFLSPLHALRQGKNNLMIIGQFEVNIRIRQLRLRDHMDVKCIIWQILASYADVHIGWTMVTWWTATWQKTDHVWYTFHWRIFYTFWRIDRWAYDVILKYSRAVATSSLKFVNERTKCTQTSNNVVASFWCQWIRWPCWRHYFARFWAENLVVGQF